MKRQWRVGRSIMSVVLIGIAAVAYWIWPGVSWKIEGEKAIGFDVTKALAFTVKTEKGKHELRGYELGSGVRRVTIGLGVGNENESLERQRAPWQWLLSPNKRDLVCIHVDNVYVVNLESGLSIKKIKLDVSALTPWSRLSAGFSKNGSFLALRDDTTGSIKVWNIPSGNVIDEIPSTNAFVSPYVVTYEIHHNQLDIDPSGRYLAIWQGDRAIIHDTVEKKQVFDETLKTSARFYLGRVPRFLDEGKLLLFAPVKFHDTHKAVWFRKTVHDDWITVPNELGNVTQESCFVGYTDRLLVTDSPNKKMTERPGWMPDILWGWGNRLFGFNGTRHHLHFWDVHSGQQVSRFRFFEALMTDSEWGSENIEQPSFFSEDGNWLARDHEDEVTVYDTTGRRTLGCWVVVISLVLLAVWSGRPRRIAPLPLPPSSVRFHG